MTDATEDVLLRIDVHGERMARSAGASARVAAEDLGMGAVDAERVGRLVERVSEIVARTDFDDPAGARFSVTLTERPAALGVRVADHGLPISLGGEAGRRVATTLAAEDLVDRVQVRSDGDGNAVDLEVRRHPGALDHLVDEATPTDESPRLAPPRIERLRRDHLESLARCTWRVYGHTYVADFLYHPDATWALVEQGRLHSVVAVDDEGEVVGHVAIELERPGDQVGDFTLALTDPRYRGHHVLGQAGDELGAVSVELGLVGSLAEAVTPHTITQRARVEGGAVETAVLLGFIPATMTYRGFSPDVQGTSRQSAVLSYRPFGSTAARTVFLPDAYRGLLVERYAAMGLDRPEGPGGRPTGSTVLDVALDRPRALATLEVATVGADAAHVIGGHRRALCAAGVEVVYAELPLDDPGTPMAVEALREQGFAWGGVIPDLRGTDVLRLQYLDVEVDTEIIQLYTDDARRLLAFTLADRA